MLVPLGSELSGGRTDIIVVVGKDTMVDTVFAWGTEIGEQYLNLYIKNLCKCPLIEKYIISIYWIY